MADSYARLEERFKRLSALADAEEFLHWDTAVMMPPGGAASRGEQLAALRAVRHGLLASAKGRGGGFALAMRPGNITLYDIVEAIDGVSILTRCAVGMAGCDDDQPCPHHDEWAAVREHIRRFLEETTLEQMALTLEKKLEQLGQTKPKPRSKSKPVRRPE